MDLRKETLDRLPYLLESSPDDAGTHGLNISGGEGSTRRISLKESHGSIGIGQHGGGLIPFQSLLLHDKTHFDLEASLIAKGVLVYVRVTSITASFTQQSKQNRFDYSIVVQKILLARNTRRDHVVDALNFLLE